MRHSDYYGSKVHFDGEDERQVRCGRPRIHSIFTSAYDRVTCGSCWERIWEDVMPDHVEVRARLQPFAAWTRLSARRAQIDLDKS